MTPLHSTASTDLSQVRYCCKFLPHLCCSPSVSVLQFTSRLTSPSPDVCQMQRCPSLVLSSPEPGTERFLGLLAGGGEDGGWRGLSGLPCPGCRLASARTGKQRRRRKRKLHGRTLIFTAVGHLDTGKEKI